MEIKRVEEIKLLPKAAKEIKALLQECFPNYPKNRTYYHQIPDFRYLAYDKKKLIGQMSVDHRIMDVDGAQCTVLGISDFCISAEMRKKKIASKMLGEIERFGLKYKVDFLVLTTLNSSLYKKNGFKRKSNICKWLAVLKGQTLGVHYKRLDNSIMVKELNDKRWGNGDVDFLGPIF
jgi:predicted acetyltransferase